MPMMASTQISPGTAPQQRQQLPPKTIFDRYPGVVVSIAAGVGGMFLGATRGIIMRKRLVVSTVANGIMFGFLGPVFYKTREFVLPGVDVTPSQKIKASAIAGAYTGLMMGVIFTKAVFAFPAAAVLALSGAGGQYMLNKMAAPAASASASEDKGWSLLKMLALKKLTDQEYEEKLEAKILELEASIALIDENIVALEAQRPATNEPAGEPGRASAGPQ